MSTETPNAVTAPAPRAVVYPTLHQAGSTETDGFTRGHAAGYAAGLRKAAVEQETARRRMEAEHADLLDAGRDRIERAVAVLEEAGRSLQARTAPVLADADATLAQATLALAEAVICVELSDAPRAAKAALTRALSAPDAESIIGIRLNPADVALLAAAPKPVGVALVADASIAPGEAAADYPDGELDARISTSLARARTALLGDHA